MENIENGQKNNKKLVVVGLIILLVAGAIGGYIYWLRTPQYSLNQIKKAVEQHDLVTFEKHVDIDSLVTRFIDQAISKEMGDSNEDIDTLAAGFIEMLKPQIVEVAKNQIKTYVEKGNFEDVKEDDTETPFKNFYKDVNGEGVQFRGIDEIKKSGKIAIIGLKLYSKKFEEELVLEVKMRKLDNYWQVVEFNNISDFVDKMNEFETNKLAILNEPFINEMDNALSYENIEMQKIEGDEWGFSKEVHFPVTIKFLTDKNIVELGATISAKNKEGKVILEIPVSSTGSTYKGKISTVTWVMEINPFIEADETLYNTPNSEMELSLSTNYLVYEDGTEVKLLTELP